jgi:prevent-host-death family protein
MIRIGIRELRDNLTSTIRRVRAGERFEVTHDGTPVALLTPVPDDRLARLVAEGLVSPARGPLVLPRPMPVTGPMTASEALQEGREDRV